MFISLYVHDYRKSLQGIDSFVSEGGQAFDDLQHVTEELARYCKGSSWKESTQRNLKESKQYLKSEYKVRY